MTDPYQWERDSCISRPLPFAGMKGVQVENYPALFLPDKLAPPISSV